MGIYVQLSTVFYLYLQNNTRWKVLLVYNLFAVLTTTNLSFYDRSSFYRPDQYAKSCILPVAENAFSSLAYNFVQTSAVTVNVWLSLQWKPKWENSHWSSMLCKLLGMGELGKKMPTIFRRLAYVYFEIEAIFIREKNNM